jgi:hypothetical protein
MSRPPAERDAWLDRYLGIDGVADDGPALPPGCVPYVPCPVDPLIRMCDRAVVKSSDVLVDVGSGLGRAMLLTHLLTGAATVGIEVQPGLVRASRELARRLNAEHVAVVEGDAVRLTGSMTMGTVFLLYCPFSGGRLERVLDDLEPLARARPIRICCVDLPLPARPWLEREATPDGDLVIYRGPG